MTLQRTLRFGFLALAVGLAAVLPSAAQVGGSGAPQSLQASSKLLRSPRKGNKHAPLVSDNFDFDDNGWTGFFLEHQDTLFPIQFFPAGGASGGYIGYNSGKRGIFGFKASDHFDGERGAAYGGSLTFSARGGVSDLVLIAIVSPMGVIKYQISNIPTLTTWKQFTISLSPEAGWTVGGQPLTRSQMVCALQGIQTLVIGRFDGEASIDEVHLNAPTEAGKGRITPGSVDFGKVNAGSVTTKRVRVTCTSKQAAFLMHFENVPEGFKIVPVGDYCGAIPPGGYQDFDVTFSPAHDGAFGGSATIVTGQGSRIPYKLKGIVAATTGAPNVAGVWKTVNGTEFDPTFVIEEKDGNLTGQVKNWYYSNGADGTISAAYTPDHLWAFLGTYSVPGNPPMQPEDHGQMFVFKPDLTKNPPTLSIIIKSASQGVQETEDLYYSGPVPASDRR